MTMNGRAEPGGALLHPLPVLAVGVLLLNDHVLKQQWGHPVTGILSDLAGLLFFPLLLVAVVELSLHAGGWYRRPSNRLLVAATAATAVAFTIVQTSSVGGEAYRYGLGALQDPFGLVAMTLGHSASVEPVALTPDFRDLWALPVLMVPLVVGSDSSRHR